MAEGPEKKRRPIGANLAIGIATGVAIGAALGNIAVGIAIGFVFAAGLQRR